MGRRAPGGGGVHVVAAVVAVKWTQLTGLKQKQQ